MYFDPAFHTFFPSRTEGPIGSVVHERSAGQNLGIQSGCQRPCAGVEKSALKVPTRVGALGGRGRQMRATVGVHV